ncbi:MAG: hypothetical protein ACOC22_00910 [bacterium]
MKKPILIDEFTNYVNNTTEFKLTLHGTDYKFWKIIKPLIDISFITRIYHSYLVLLGKAHAFQFFQDLSYNQQKQWVADDVKRQVGEYVKEKRVCLKCNCKKDDKK